MNDDIKLITGTLRGDTYSFEELVLRYEKGILNFIYNMTGNRQSAEELTQDVFITVYNKLYSFNREKKFSTWLYRIARNKCIDYLRKHRGKDEISVEELQITSSDGSPEGYVLYQETKNNVRQFLKTLKDKDRDILILKYSQEHMTFCDIGELLSMSEASVKKRYYKIYDRYEKFIEEIKLDQGSMIGELGKGGVL